MKQKQKKAVIISLGSIELKVILNETSTAAKLIKALPFYSNANRWGDEIYFSVPMDADIENGVEEVESGTVAFWPPGNALCIFFGRTPVSDGEKPRAASPVTVVGSIADKNVLKKLKEIKNGEKVYCRPVN